MGDYGDSTLSGAITSQRSYGSTSNQSFSLAVFDAKVISHELQPTDTLQGLAIKYSVSIERIKRLNKLWSSESIHTLDTILIPCSKENAGCESPKTRYVDSLERKKQKQKRDEPMQSDPDELQSSLKENEGDASNTGNSTQGENETVKSYQEMFKKIDSQIKTHKKTDDLGSDSYKCFTEMLSKIDEQIKTHKEKSDQELMSQPTVPDVGYDSYQNRLGSPLSPSKQHPFLEQGI